MSKADYYHVRKYELIRQAQEASKEQPLSRVLARLGIPRATYYYWLKQPDTKEKLMALEQEQAESQGSAGAFQTPGRACVIYEFVRKAEPLLLQYNEAVFSRKWVGDRSRSSMVIANALPNEMTFYAHQLIVGFWPQGSAKRCARLIEEFVASVRFDLQICDQRVYQEYILSMIDQPVPVASFDNGIGTAFKSPHPVYQACRTFASPYKIGKGDFFEGLVVCESEMLRGETEQGSLLFAFNGTVQIDSPRYSGPLARK